MGHFASKRPSYTMYAVALAGVVLTVGATRISGFDVWWHITTGWVIANLHEIPRYDLFSYTSFGAPWVNHEWLFELLQWFVYSTGGIKALTAIKLVLVTGISWLLFRTIRLMTNSRLMALWGTLFFLWGASYRILDRPYLFGMLFLAFYSYVLHRHAAASSRLIWLLPLCQVIWINSHGGGLLGVELTLAFAAGETLQGLASRWMGAPPAIPGSRRKNLWTIALLCILASFANPWGANTFLFFGEHARMTAILAYTQEWLPLLHPQLDGLIPPAIYTASLLLTFASFVVNARRARISHLLITILTSAVLYMGHRFGPEFMVVNLPIMFFNFKNGAPDIFLKRTSNHIAEWINLTAVFIISVATMVWGVPIHIEGTIFNEMGFGVDAKFAPRQMVDFLEFHGIGGKVFNDMGLGAYLIFRRWPGEQVAIDGRTPIYGDTFYEEFVDASRNKRNFEEFDRKFGFDYIVQSSHRAWDRRGFHKYLWENPNWSLVYAGYDGLVYLRKDGKNGELIEKLALDESPVVKMMEAEEKRGEKEDRGRAGSDKDDKSITPSCAGSRG